MSRVFPKFFEKEGKFWVSAFEIGAQPSSVRCAASFSQREKPLVRRGLKAFSLWEKVAPKATDEGTGSPSQRRDFQITISLRTHKETDCHVAGAPRNDSVSGGLSVKFPKFSSESKKILKIP
jgi:hypothetical protein